MPFASPPRPCARCGAAITACNGFVKAGDVVEGRPAPRELCGRCGLSWEWTESGELVEAAP